MVAVPAKFASSQSEAIVARLAPMVLPAGLAGSKPEPAGKVVTENDGDRETEAKRQRGRRCGPSRKVSRTDPGCEHGDVGLRPAA